MLEAILMPSVTSNTMTHAIENALDIYDATLSLSQLVKGRLIEEPLQYELMRRVPPVRRLPRRKMKLEELRYAEDGMLDRYDHNQVFWATAGRIMPPSAQIFL